MPSSGPAVRAGARRIWRSRFGNVYVSGAFQNTVDFNPSGGAVRSSNAGSMNNIYISSFSADGAFRWVQNWGPSDGGAEIYSLAIDSSEFLRRMISGRPNSEPPPAAIWRAAS